MSTKLGAIQIGETLPTSRRVAQSTPAILRAYGKLASNSIFILPALATSLLMSGLFASFAAAPSILMEGMGLNSLQVGLHFAATVFVVFAAGLAAPRLAHRCGSRAMTLEAGLASALLGFLTMAIRAVSTWMVSTPKFPTAAVLGATQTAVCLLAIVLFAGYVKRSAPIRAE